jgi:hypothetical protein
MQGIVVATYTGSPFNFPIYTEYPVFRINTDDKGYEFELGALKRAYEETELDEILLLQDSCKIKDPTYFKVWFEEHKGRSLFLSKRGLSYIAKYRREILDKMEIPTISTKTESVRYEGRFNDDFAEMTRRAEG